MVMVTSQYYRSLWIKRAQKKHGALEANQHSPLPPPRSFQKQTGAIFNDNRLSMATSGTSQSLTNGKSSKSTELTPSDIKTRLLIMGRMSSASSATARLFSLREDVFYLGEPGHMMFKMIFHKDVHIDSRDYVDEMQQQLCQFLGDMFSCNFSSHGYFVDTLNEKKLYRGKGSLQKLDYPITESGLTELCQSKSHIISKVLRLSDVTQCLPTFQQNNVKFLFLVRDPRGLVTSRLRRWGTILAKVNDKTSDKYYPVAKMVEDHCAWLDKVFNLLTNGPRWFRENSMLVRFDDKCMYPGTIDQAICDFVGITAPSPSSPISKSYNESAINWLIAHSYERIKEIQDYCPKHIYNEFGWLMINDKKEFEQAKRHGTDQCQVIK
ncbi:carbohydrate sulfotransferase 1-like [Ptychodera flava]|uniref:carbohydrate sulfotransferase 1-like n=1 Tax=Ptychodera flava TaxID=63121 RepID=UPI003969C88B